MNWKTTVALAVIVIVGAMYIQFVEKGRDTTKIIEEKGKKVFQIKDLSDHIGEITVSREDGEFKFERKGDGTDDPWRMLEPLKVRADKSEVKAIASKLEELEVKSAVSSEGGKLDLSEYGLDKPRATVSFKAFGDEYTLLIGGKSPSGKGELFVKRGNSDKIYLVGDDIYDKVKKSKEEFRDKKVVNLEKDDVIGVQLAWGEAKDKVSVTAKREKGQWSLTRPVEDYAEKSKIEDLVGDLKDLKIDKEDFLAEEVDDPAKYGLDKPALTAVIEVDKEQKGEESGEGAKLKFELVFGKKVEGKKDRIYAKRKDEPTLFAVKDDILDDLSVGEVKDLRSDDFGMFEDDDVNKVEISLASSNVVVEKVKEKKGDDGDEGEEKWKVTKPKETKTQQSTVDGLIDDLDSTDIKEFVSEDPTDEELEKFGLKTPLATVTVHLKDGGGALSYEIGSRHEKEKDQFYARRAGRKSVFLVEEAGLHRDLLAGYLLFKEKQVIKFTESDAQKLIVAREGKTVVLTKKDDDWQLTQPVTAPADSGNVDSLLWEVDSLTAKRFVAESPKDLAEFGLQEPKVKVTIEVKEEVDEDDDDDPKEGEDEDEKKVKKERTIILLIGNKIEDEEDYYAKLAEGDNKDFVFTVSKYCFEKVTTELHDREVVNIAKGDVTELVIRHKDETVTCKKEDDQWKITTPKEAEGKKSEIEDLLEELDPLKADRLASYKAVGAAELKPYGLDVPEVTVTVKLKEGKEETLEIGTLTKVDKEEYYYIRCAKKDGVYLVGKGDAEDLKKRFSDLAKVEEKEEEKQEGAETEKVEETEPKKEEGTEAKKEGGDVKEEKAPAEDTKKAAEPKAEPKAEPAAKTE